LTSSFVKLISNCKNEGVFIYYRVSFTLNFLLRHSYNITNSTFDLQSKIQIKKKLLNAVVLFFSICIEMDSVRKAILRRDNYECQDYNILNKKLTIHHIKESHKHPELKFKRSNLITLCKRCHSLRHNKKIK